MSSINTEKLLEAIKAYFATPEILDIIERLKSSGLLNKLRLGLALVLEGIVVVEAAAVDLSELGITGSEKKEALVKLLDDVVDVPFWAEPFDGMIIGMAIDAAVGYYNIKIGHGWFDVVKKFLF